MNSITSSLTQYRAEKRANKQRNCASALPLRGSISQSFADGSGLRQRVTFEGFERRTFQIGTCKSGGVPIQLLTPEGNLIEVRLDKTSLKTRFKQNKSQAVLDTVRESQLAAQPERLHAAIQTVARNITNQDLENALYAVRDLTSESRDQKIAWREYNAANPTRPIPRNIIFVDGKAYLHLNRHTACGDPTIAKTPGKKNIAYCVGLHDNKLYAMISSVAGMPHALNQETPYLKALQGQPNIVQSFGALQGEGVVSHKPKYAGFEKAYLVESLYQGGNLATTQIKDETQKLAIAKQMTAGLAAMHRQGIVNRDIKPENIFLQDNAHAHIGDFDTACFLNDSKERVRKEGGTFPYLAPELAKLHSNSQAEISSAEALKINDRPLDVYGMGCTLHELFIGPIQQYSVFPDVATDLNPLKAVAAIDKDWMPKPAANAPTIHHIIWSMVHVDPAQRITADQAAALVATL